MTKNLFIILLAFFIIVPRTQAARSQCSKEFENDYLSTNKKNYGYGITHDFGKMADHLIAAINENPKSAESQCLSDLYENKMADAGKKAGEKFSHPSCLEKCKQDIELLQNKIAETDRDLKKQLSTAGQDKQIQNNTCDNKTSQMDLLASTKNSLCCGNKSETGTGAVRGLFPDISYESCLEKTSATNKELLSLSGVGSCVGNLIKESLTTLWNNLTGILSVPAELWAARSQIWQLMTNSDARAEFAKKLTTTLKKYITDRVDSLNTCLNEYESKQFFCKISGQIIGELATPTSILKLFKIILEPAKAMKVINQTLSKSEKGKALLAKLNKANKNSRDAVAKVGKTTHRIESKFDSATKQKLKEMAAKSNSFAENFRKSAKNESSVRTSQFGARTSSKVIEGQTPVATQFAALPERLDQKNNLSPVNMAKNETATQSRINKYQSERSKNSVSKILENSKYKGKSLSEIVRKNATLNDRRREKAIKADFPHLSNKQVKDIVEVVHHIGSDRPGAGVYHYTDQEIIAKMKKLKDLGISAEDRRALLTLGYAGENTNLFKALLKGDINRSEFTSSKSDRGSSPPPAREINDGSEQQPLNPSEKLTAAKKELSEKSRDPLAKARLRNEINDLEKEAHKHEISEYQKTQPEHDFKKFLEDLDRENPRKTADPSTDDIPAIPQSHQPALQLSPAKINQLKALGADDLQITLAAKIPPGKEILYHSEKTGSHKAVFKSPDPENPDNWLIEVATQDPLHPKKTISVPQTSVAISDKDLSALAFKKIKLEGTPETRLLTEGSKKPFNAEKTVEKLAQQAMEHAKHKPEILKKEQQIEELKKELGPRSDFHPQVMAMQKEVDDLKYKSSPLNEHEISMFKALEEIPKGITEFSPQEKALIEDLKKIKSKKEFFSDTDKRLFNELEQIQTRPAESRKAQLRGVLSEAKRLNVGDYNYSHVHYSVTKGVNQFEKEVGSASWKKNYEKQFEKLFKSSPSDIFHADSDVKTAYQQARSFYQDYSKKADNGPGVKFMLERVKLYVDSFENKSWLYINDSDYGK